MVILDRQMRFKGKRRCTLEELQWADSQFREGTAESYEGVERMQTFHDQLRVGFEMLGACE